MFFDFDITNKHKILLISIFQYFYLSFDVIQAAWGGGLLMSETFRKDRFLGVERADSLTWNPHKLLGALLQCSTFHLKVKVESDD